MSVNSRQEIEKDFKIKSKGSKIYSGNTTNSLNSELYQQVENQMIAMLEKEIST